ncbi:MAG: Ig-like domain-containing protein, partial [Bacteroidota bacterium]|nr:Ig-like domain-containing protein [Bacteroidota bacterium]
GAALSYSWSSSCGGSFSSSTVSNPSFTPPVVLTPTNCKITVTVTDACGRSNFASVSVIVYPAPTAPVANNDVGNIAAECATAGLSETVNVLANDNDINGDALTVTSVTGNNGTWTHNGTTVTFEPNDGFSGLATATYTVCDPGNLCATATVSVNVGLIDIYGCNSAQFYGYAYSGTGETVIVAGTNSIGSQDNAVGEADGTLAAFNATTDSITIQLDNTLLSNDSLNIIWASNVAGTATIRVRVSATEAGPYTLLGDFNRTGTTLGTSFVNNTFGPISYVTIRQISSNALNIDAIEFNVKGCVSRAPVANSASYTIIEDSFLVINVLDDVEDPLGSAIKIKRIVSQPANGYVSINADGTITYAPKKDVAGSDLFTYEVSNAEGYTTIATINISIIEDDCPVGQYKPLGSVTGTATYNPYSDGYLAKNNANASLMTGNTFLVGQKDNSITRGLLMFQIFGTPLSGTAPLTTSVITSATLRLTHTAKVRNKSTVSAYYVTQPWDSVNNDASWNERDNSANLAWTNVGGTFNTSVQGSVKALNDQTGNITLSISSLVQNWVNSSIPNYGLILRTAENEGKNLTFGSVENGTAGNRPLLTINYLTQLPCRITPNRAPLAGKDIATTPAGQQVSVSVLSNDFNVDPTNTFGAPTIVLNPVNGMASVSGNNILYTPNTNFNGVEQIRYRICNNNGLCDTGIIEITVTNTAPIANVDVVSMNSGGTQNITVKANDDDTDGPASGAPTITSDPKNGYAIVSLNTITYTPNPGYTGKDSLIYQICETAAGGCNDAPLCDTAIVFIYVNNQTPTAVADNATILPCNPVVINLISNDTDPENGVLQVTNLSALSNPMAGSLVNNNDGTVTFDPVTGFLGTVTFTYTVTDDGLPPLTSSPATVTINVVAPINTAPIAVDDAEEGIMDSKLYLSVLDNDTDPEGNSLTGPTLTMLPVHGTAVVLGNGLVEFTPNPGFFGYDTFAYQICDVINDPITCMPATGLCDLANGTVIYIAPPNTVFAENDENSTNINTAVSGNLLTNDFDLEGDNIDFLGFIDGLNLVQTGTINVSGVDVNGTIVANAGSILINANGTYTYTPALNFVGFINVPYSITDDGSPEAFDTAFLRINVVPALSAGNSTIANNDENISYGDPVSGNVKFNDVDPQGDATLLNGFNYDSNGDGIQDATGVLGTPTIIGGKTTTGVQVSAAGSLTLNANGTYTFTPAVDFHGSIDIVYEICDNGSPVKCAKATLHIDVVPNINGPANDPPFAGDDFALTTSNIPVTGNFIQNDSDPNGNPITFNSTVINSGGPATPIGAPVATVNGGTIQFYANGTFLYTPASNYVGPDSYVYAICDQTIVNPQPLCASGTIYLLVQDLPQADLVVNKTVNNATPNVGSNITFTITASNNGPNNATGVSLAEAIPAGYTLVSVTPSIGTWLAPNWTIGDLANGGSATLSVVVTVNASGSYANTATITGNETDPNTGNNTSTITPVPVPVADLAVVKTVNNPTPNVGTDVTFTITASNNGPSNATGVTVADAIPAGYTLVSVTPSIGTWSAPNWTIGDLVNGGSATLSVVVTVNTTGSYANTATISGSQADPVSGNNTSTVTPNVNFLPLAIWDAVTTDEDAPVNGTVASNDILSGDGGNVWTLVTGPTNGSVVVNADGTYTYTPNANFNGN